MPLVQVSGALSGECVMCSIFCFEVQISFPVMMETMLIRWNTVFHMYTGLDGTRVIQSGSCLSCWHSACCASAAKGIPIPSVVFVLFCWLSASLLLSLALEGWEECQDRGFGSGGKGVGAAGATCAPALGDLAPLQNRAGRWQGLSDKSVHYYRCTKCCSNGLQQCRGI